MSAYGETLIFYLTQHRDAVLVMECENANDFGIRLIAQAYDKDPAQVIFDLREKADELWPSDEM
jgi:hypothetical protein